MCRRPRREVPAEVHNSVGRHHWWSTVSVRTVDRAIATARRLKFERGAQAVGGIVVLYDDEEEEEEEAVSGGEYVEDDDEASSVSS